MEVRINGIDVRDIDLELNPLTKYRSPTPPR
jgi:hypothetical protein